MRHKATHLNDELSSEEIADLQKQIIEFLPYKCLKCETYFDRKSDYNIHETTHQLKRNFSCTVCPKTFKHLQSLTKHEKKHTKNKTFECQTCEMIFHYLDLLRRHEKVHIINSSDLKTINRVCEKCDKVFMSKSALKIHNTRKHKSTN